MGRKKIKVEASEDAMPMSSNEKSENTTNNSNQSYSPKRLRTRDKKPDYKSIGIRYPKDSVKKEIQKKDFDSETENDSSKKPPKRKGKSRQEENECKVELVPLKKSKGKQKKGEKRQLNGDAETVKEESVAKEEEIINSDKKSDDAKSTKKVKLQVEKTAVERSVLKKGAAAVDGLCPIASSSHVYYDNDEIWDCMLNQTNIQFNNNKYYIIQLLKEDDKNVYSVWMRWGRVGCPGQNSLKPFAGNLEKAKETFKKKFSDKTRNEWEERDEFVKVAGKYDLLEMDYSDGKDEKDGALVKMEDDSKPIKKVESKLEIKVKVLIELICNVKAMEEAVIEMKYDAKKAPLGKLTMEQVKAGYSALKNIESIIGGSGKPSNRDLVEACNAFYTRIPHYFGMKVPPLIRTKQEIQEKLTLLQALGDIQAAMNIINKPQDRNLHPADQHYNGLECDIETLGKDDPNYMLLEKFLESTHGKTHTMYTMNLIDIFKVNKLNEGERFNDVGNRMLLWHGSRLTNWAGILSQGLRIAPPEAPCTGYMFGKGIYFADMASKSANYCMPSYQNKTGLLVLCDVALGKCNELVNANYEAHKLPKGCHSVKGLGRSAPDPKNKVTLSDGTILPMGPGVDINGNSKQAYTLQYNEYIVYDVSQVQIKYLLNVEFKFKGT